MNAEFVALPWPENFVDWLQHQKEPDALKAIATSAIDAFRSLSNGTILREGPLSILYEAACHPRFVVWEVGLPLLAKLAETDSDARAKIAALSCEGRSELRRRSIQYLIDRHSRSFCLSILRRLLTDRSAKVKDVVAARISSLNLTELIPALEHALSEETNSGIRWSYTHVISLMQHGFHYDARDDKSTLWLQYPDAFPVSAICISEAQSRFEKGDDIEQIKADCLQRYPHMFHGRRDWDWGDEKASRREHRS